MSILVNNLAITIGNLANELEEFDSHQAIESYKKSHHVDYLTLLAAVARRLERSKKEKKSSPEHCLHTSLGIKIKGHCEDLGLQRSDFRSKDVNGQMSCCLRWTRRRNS